LLGALPGNHTAAGLATKHRKVSVRVMGILDLFPILGAALGAATGKPLVPFCGNSCLPVLDGIACPVIFIIPHQEFRGL